MLSFFFGWLRGLFSGLGKVGAVLAVLATVVLVLGIALLPYLVIAHFVIKYW